MDAAPRVPLAEQHRRRDHKDDRPKYRLVPREVQKPRRRRRREHKKCPLSYAARLDVDRGHVQSVTLG